MRVLEKRIMVAVCLLWVVVPAVRADYSDEVLSDEPVAYWRLGESDPFEPALNSAEIDVDPAALDGAYVGGVILEEDPLIFDDPDPAVRFNGIDTQIDIPDSTYTNSGGPWTARTIELWFNAEVIDARAMLFEGGGTTRGLAIWVEEVDAQDTLFMSMWNRAEDSWQPVYVSAEVEEGVTYHAVMVFDSGDNNGLADFDGRITGYLNGEEFETAIGADDLHAHGDDYAIGAVRQNTYYLDGSNPGSGDFFTGIIDEVAIYDKALDDPDDDGDLGDSRVMDHYLAGLPPPVAGCPEDLNATVEGASVRLSWTKGGETSVRVLRDGVELAAAAPVDPSEYVDANPPPGSLQYELQFTLPGENCALSRRIDTCISGFTLARADGNVELAWQNGLLYSGVVVMRGTDTIATLPGDATSYVDVNPPAGTWTYSVAPESGTCASPSATTVVLKSDYGLKVLASGALAYWTLGEEEGTLAANAGSAGRPLDGTYMGGVELGQDSLVSTVPDNLAIRLNGIDGQVHLPDSPLTNSGGPFQSKSIELWFQADLIDEEPRIVFEEGGTTNGFSIYVQAVDGDPQLFMVAWSQAQNWDSIAVSTDIQESVPYHAVMVFDGSANDVIGDFDGRVTGYVNGSDIGTQIGADQMNNHDNDGGLGAVFGGETQLADNTDLTSGGFFAGVIDDLSLYDIPLDDPNDDGDFSDSLVVEHFATGLGAENCPLTPEAERDGANVRLSWARGVSETSVRIVRNGAELVAAAPVDPPQYVDTTAAPGRLVYELTFDSPGCPTLTRQYDACITDLVAESGARSAQLSWVNNLAYTEITIQRGGDVIATISGDQTSYTDAEAPTGLVTYSVAPTNGDCEPTTVEVLVFTSAYPGTVLRDSPNSYWRLDEDDEFAPALNSGAAGAATDGTFTGTLFLENDGLLAADAESTSVLFEGIDGMINIPDHNTINLGGPFTAQSVELWFRADVVDVEPRVLYEQGGNTRGICMYVQEVDGAPLLYMSAWNVAQESWAPVFVGAEIEPDEIYHAVLVYDASENETFGDFDGRVTGYLNGEEIETAIGADRLYEHTDDIAIGGQAAQMLLVDGSAAAGLPFSGAIDEVAHYGYALDDPDGDKDFDNTIPMAHYLAGTEGGGGPGGASLKPGDVNADGSYNIADMVAQLNFLFGGAALPECYVVPDSNPVAINATGLAILDYNGDGSSNIADAVGGLNGLFGGGAPHVLGEGCAEIAGACESNCVE